MTVRKLALLVLSTVALISCAGGTGESGSTIVLGAPLGLTGSLTKESKLTQQGYNLWLDWVNARGGIVVNGVKHKVTIKYYDDTSNANQSAVFMQKLITEDHANFLLGPYGSAATATDAAIAEQNQIPMVEANGAAQSIFNQGYKYTFGVLSPANKYLQGVLDMAATLNPKPTTIAMLSADDNFSLEVAQGIIDYAPTKGMQVILYKKYTADFYLSVADYVAAYKAKYPSEGAPDYHVAESTAACLALQRAIENAKSLDPKKVRDALAALDVTTFYGKIKFDSRGINVSKPMVVEQIQNGQHHTVFPADVADKQAMYPTPGWDQR